MFYIRGSEVKDENREMKNEDEKILCQSKLQAVKVLPSEMYFKARETK